MNNGLMGAASGSSSSISPTGIAGYGTKNPWGDFSGLPLIPQDPNNPWYAAASPPPAPPPETVTGPSKQEPGTIDFSQSPWDNSIPYGKNAADQAGVKAFRTMYGATEDWVQKQLAAGKKITGTIPRGIQGDINQWNRYGMIAPNIDTKNKKIAVSTNQGTVWRDMTADELSHFTDYETWLNGETNKPGGGAVDAWGNYLGFGPDVASGNYAGAYAAYHAQQAIAAGQAPGTGFGFGESAGTSPLGIDPFNGLHYNQLTGGREYYGQYGIPLGFWADGTAPAANTQPTALFSGSGSVTPERGGSSVSSTAPPKPPAVTANMDPNKPPPFSPGDGLKWQFVPGKGWEAVPVYSSPGRTGPGGPSDPGSDQPPSFGGGGGGSSGPSLFSVGKTPPPVGINPAAVVSAQSQASRAASGGPPAPPGSITPQDAGKTSATAGVTPSSAGVTPANYDIWQGLNPSVGTFKGGSTTTPNPPLPIGSIPNVGDISSLFSSAPTSATVQGIMNLLTSLAGNAGAGASSLLATALPGYQNAMNYLQAILGGGPAAQAALAPQVEALRESGAGTEQALEGYLGRTGQAGEQMGSLERGIYGSIAGLRERLIPTIAGQIMTGGLGGASAASNFYQVALQSLGVTATTAESEANRIQQGNEFGKSLSAEVRQQNISLDLGMSSLALQQYLGVKQIGVETQQLAQQWQEFQQTYGLQTSYLNLAGQAQNWLQQFQQQQLNNQLGMGIGGLFASLLGMGGGSKKSGNPLAGVTPDMVPSPNVIGSPTGTGIFGSNP